MRTSLFAMTMTLALSCAETRPPPPLPPRPVERSSIDVLIRHRADLDLTDEQVARLEQLDDVREREVAELSRQLQAHEEQQRTAGQRTAGMGSMGGGRGPRGSAPPRGGPRLDPEPRERVLSKIDDADTRAFIDAEGVLNEAQRAPAEKLASDFRARLFDFRDAVKRREQ